MNLPHEIASSVDWNLQFQGFSAQIEVIDGDIIHEISRGLLKEEHVDPLFNVYEKVINATAALKGPYYFIIGMTEITGGTLKAQKLYFRRMREWHKNHPLHMCVLYGPNRFMRAGFNLARPFMPFKVRIENNLDSALNVIIEEKARGANALSSPRPEDKDMESQTSGPNQPYVDELLDFMADIKWETNGFDANKKIDPSHPFSPVFDAILLIKKDLDDLLEEQKRAEEALRKSEEKYRAIIENIEEGYYEADISGNFRFFNDSFAKICGYTRDEMLGINYRQFVDEEDAKKIFEIFNSVYSAGGPSRTFDWEPVRKDGSKCSLETSLSLILDSEGQPIGFRGIIRDITERKQLEEELVKHRNHLEQAVQERTAELLKANNRLKRQAEERKKAREDNTITETRHGRGQKILIVDDETDILKPMEELLKGMGYRSASVSNGEDAIAIYASWQPDAVLMDRNMPEMDGATITKRIIEQDPDARIILVSGYDEDGPDGIDFQTRGLISGYLTKPIDTVELSRVLIWLFSE